MAPNRWNHSTRARGYSLMEVMFAIAILAVGLIAIASLFPVGLIQQKRAIDDAQGVIIGNNVLASIRASRYAAADFPAPQNTFTPINTITAAPINGDKVMRIAILDGGSGYSSAPTVTLVGGGFTTQATATAALAPSSDRVASITITANGIGYNSPPLVQFSGGGGGGGARAKAFLGSPSDFVDPTGTYDYALAYRRPAGGAVEVAVFVYRTASVPGGQSPGALTLDTAVNISPPAGTSQLGAMSAALPNSRNQFVLGYANAAPAPQPAYAMHVIQDTLVATGPPTATDRTLYLPQKALAIVTGVVR